MPLPEHLKSGKTETTEKPNGMETGNTRPDPENMCPDPQEPPVTQEPPAAQESAGTAEGGFREEKPAEDLDGGNKACPPPDEPVGGERQEAAETNLPAAGPKEALTGSFDAMEQRLFLVEQVLKDVAGQLEAKGQALQDALCELGKKQEKNDRQLTQYLRENVNFQVQVREGMQRDMDTLRKQVSGEQFNPILKVLADIYGEYRPLLMGEEDPKRLKKNLAALFGDLEDLMDDYGAEVMESRPGEERRARGTKIIEKVPTGDQEKHNKVVRSRKPGVMKDRLVLKEEYVDVYVYDPAMDVPEKEEAPEGEEIRQPAEKPENTANPEDPVNPPNTAEAEGMDVPGTAADPEVGNN